MKISGLCALFLMVVTTFAFVSFISITGPSWFPDLVGTRCGDKTTPIAVSRKLKENVESIRSNDKGGIGDQVTLKDYNPIDPLPGVGPSNVNAGPIEHGTPLMPFIPKPPPLGHPNPDQGDYN
ncbi:unnamed protein product [Trifolium pratense]|uniref:Uncharacterized protein n=1 Tax=Trifolium pratense TaxID=57577 RepID=A0ACB0JX55_TRIPR|nr:unnamed protein product [Trifolium pratense]